MNRTAYGIIAVLAVAVLALGGNQLYQAGRAAGRSEAPRAVQVAPAATAAPATAPITPSAEGDPAPTAQAPPPATTLGASGETASTPATGAESDTVHATRTGKRYHREGCRFLSKSDIPMTRQEAEAKGLTPCGVCQP